MAKKPDKGKNAKARKGPNLIVVAAIVAIFLVIALPLVIVLLVGMLPTVVAVFLIDQTKEKYSSFCVGGMNFCGTLPYLLDIWFGANTPGAAVKIITNPFSLLIMYGAAALGWALFMFVPPIVAVFLQVLNERRIDTLRQTQKRLVAEWGEGVTEAADEAREAKQQADGGGEPEVMVIPPQ